MKRTPFSIARASIKALRPKQWAKNVLILAPVVFSSVYLTDPMRLLDAVLAVASFSLLASSGYLLNDYLDREADRKHPKKSKRPIASGALPEGLALVEMVVVLLIAYAPPPPSEPALFETTRAASRICSSLESAYAPPPPWTARFESTAALPSMRNVEPVSAESPPPLSASQSDTLAASEIVADEPATSAAQPPYAAALQLRICAAPSIVSADAPAIDAQPPLVAPVLLPTTLSPTRWADEPPSR